jgi:hypothetical protein
LADRSAITPTIAKFLLWEVIRNRIPKKEYLKAVKELTLKFSYSPRVPTMLSYTLHNGYFLGETKTDFREDRLTDSNGLECGAFLQRCLAESGVEFPRKMRLLTPELADVGLMPSKAKGTYRKIFSGKPFSCEAELTPGDIIAFKGHTFVFAGYEPDASGVYQMVSYEAIGGEYRAVGRFHRKIYSNDNTCSDPKFHSGDSELPAAIIRIQDK